MSQRPTSTTRRNFLKKTGHAAAASALVATAVPHVHAAQDSTVRIALVGCGGRGTGAARNALSVQGQGPIELVAMADVFDHRLKSSYANLEKQSLPNKVAVPEDKKFISFDGYKQAIDCLRPGDVVILTTPPAFRWVHFQYAIEKGVNVFMEKPITVDGPSTRKMLELGKLSVAKNLKVGVGLMCRHCDARQQLYDRIKDGQLGELLLLRAYRIAGPTGSAFAPPKPEGMSELMYQISKFHGFLWLSGGAFSDFLIHNIDECCWMKDAWPISAKGFGGRHYRGNNVDQNFDTYNVEYTFADGTKLELAGRCMPGCYNEFASYAHGTKGLGIISTAAHTPARCRIYNGHNIKKNDLAWAYAPPEPNPYQLEWDHLIEAIRQDKPHNEVERGAQASLVTAMGRLAAHTGQLVTYEETLNHEHELGAGVDQLTFESASPLQAGPDGKYPVPMPGLLTDREYEA